MTRGSLFLFSVLATLLLHSIRPVTSTSVQMSPQQRQDVIRGVEKNLLSLFGFQRRPRPTATATADQNQLVPAAMMSLYHEKTSVEEYESSSFPLPGKHTASANTVRTFTHNVSPIDGQFPMTSNRFRLSFNVASIPVSERLTAAELQLHTSTPTPTPTPTLPVSGNSTTTPTPLAASALPSGSVTNYRVSIHDIVQPGIRGQSEPILRVIDSKVIDLSSSNSVTFDVLPAVRRWLEPKQRNYGLLVVISGLNGDKSARLVPNKHVRIRRDYTEELSAWLPKQPLLFTYTDDGRNVERKVDEIVRRAKRSKSNASLLASSSASMASKKHKRKENCRRHNLYVDFADVGWNDWIVAPPGYEAYYCHGDCPFPLADHLNSTNHAIVQTLVNSVNPAAVPKACCVPTQLTSISMLYLDEENKVVLKNYQDMAVLGCGCR